ncbi:MAG: Rha family transcriptional regulator [Candidatus Contendobacter sp.]
MSSLIPLVVLDNEPRIDSRVIAEQLGVKHINVRELIEQYLNDFEEFGKARFETEASGKTNQPQKFYLLNEDQAYLLLTYAKNTDQARELKKRLVHAFGHYRRLATTPPPKPQPATRNNPLIPASARRKLKALLNLWRPCRPVSLRLFLCPAFAGVRLHWRDDSPEYNTRKGNTGSAPQSVVESCRHSKSGGLTEICGGHHG